MRKTNRLVYDPPKAVTIETLCPECCGSDYSIVAYYDAEDREILNSPNAFMETNIQMEWSNDHESGENS